MIDDSLVFDGKYNSFRLLLMIFFGVIGFFSQDFFEGYGGIVIVVSICLQDLFLYFFLFFNDIISTIKKISTTPIIITNGDPSVSHLSSKSVR